MSEVHKNNISFEKFWADKIIAEKDKYFLFAARPASVQRIDLLGKVFYKHMGTPMINMHYKKEDFAYFFSSSKYEEFSNNFAKIFASKQALLDNLKKYKYWKKRLANLAYKVDNLKLDRKEMLDIFQKYQHNITYFGYFFLTTFTFDDYLFPKYCEILKTKVSAKEYDKILNIISSPTIVFGYQKYQRDLAKMASNIDYDYLIKHYDWVKEYSLQEELLNKKIINKDLANFKKQGFLKKFKEIDKQAQKNQELLEKFLNRFQDETFKAQTRFINEYINIKTDRIEGFKFIQAHFRKFFKYLFTLLKPIYPTITYKDVISLTDKEIISFLKNPNYSINIKNLKKRANKEFVLILKNNELHFIYHKSLVNKVRSNFLDVKKQQTIKGVVVSSGQASGRVRIVLGTEDFKNFKKDEILVCNFTNPDYMPVINKAKAIITDDGGITSHAAIIARELNKPCVTGTKQATRALKSGDKVKVEADKGLVKIIN